MAKLIIDGKEFTADEFLFKNGVLYIDGHPVLDYEERAIRIDGQANIQTNRDVVFREAVENCTISATRVILNAPVSNCKITAAEIINNVNQKL